MHVYACLLAFMIYIHVCLPRSRFCHAWPSVGLSLLVFRATCLCLAASVSLVACLDVTASETHLRDVGVLDAYLPPLHAMILCLPCLLCATHLALFVSLHLCTLAYMFMHESLCVLVCVIKFSSYNLMQVHNHL